VNPLAKIDAAILRAADGVVLAAWNGFSLPRIVLIRSALVVWVVGRGTLSVAEGRVTAWTVLWLLGMLFIGAVEEFNAARHSARVQNARTLATRTDPLNIIIRWFAITLPLRVYNELAILDFAATLAASAFFILSQSVTPEEPPKRRRRKAALKPSELPNRASFSGRS
jgi:hypothetical protein